MEFHKALKKFISNYHYGYYQEVHSKEGKRIKLDGLCPKIGKIC